MTQFYDNLEVASYWEEEVRKYFISLGYSVRKYECYDGYYNTTPQYYIYVDGSENNPHPDFIISLNESKRYIEVKSNSDYFYQANDSYLGFEAYKFESYLKLSKWKNTPCSIVFTMHTIDDAWYMGEINHMNKKKVYFPFRNNSYFWNIKDLKKIK